MDRALPEQMPAYKTGRDRISCHQHEIVDNASDREALVDKVFDSKLESLLGDLAEEVWRDAG